MTKPILVFCLCIAAIGLLLLDLNVPAYIFITLAWTLMLFGPHEPD